MAMTARRIEKELSRFSEGGDDGLTLRVISPTEWQVSFVGADGTIYAGESYTLKITFTDRYPMESPIVVFLLPSPVHSHVYTCGHICLNVLGDDWSPALTVKSVVFSVFSMLSSAAVKERPPDDRTYSATHMNSNPKNTRFAYHDDTV